MKRIAVALLAALVVGGVLCPPDCPAPMIWRKGEGWTWERSGLTTGSTPAEQLQIARDQLARQAYGNAVAAYRRLVRRWPTSAAVEEARMGLAESLTALGYSYDAFREYQQLVEKHPNSPHFETALQRQFDIGTRFQAGERQKRWGIRWLPSVDKAREIYEQVVKNGPYSAVGPQAQLAIGDTYVKQKEYLSAVRAYERVLERYPKHSLAELAQFNIGETYRAETQRSEYDQNAANQAIAAYNEFLVRYPDSPRAPEVQGYFEELKLEQVRGLFQIGEFYEKRGQRQAALLYYNDVIAQNPRTPWAITAQARIVALSSPAETAAP
ncbi:outer membrane protein assembly factor BamD [bacterium]|nr:outer membrane protein assembly factor BamD [bacterium]